MFVNAQPTGKKSAFLCLLSDSYIKKRFYSNICRLKISPREGNMAKAICKWVRFVSSLTRVVEQKKKTLENDHLGKEFIHKYILLRYYFVVDWQKSTASSRDWLLSKQNRKSSSYFPNSAKEKIALI